MCYAVGFSKLTVLCGGAMIHSRKRGSEPSPPGPVTLCLSQAPQERDRTALIFLHPPCRAVWLLPAVATPWPVTTPHSF